MTDDNHTPERDAGMDDDRRQDDRPLFEDGGTEAQDHPNDESAPPQNQQQDSREARPVEGSQGGQPSQPPTPPEDNVQLDPWQIKDNIVNSTQKSETVYIDTEWGELRYTIHMPGKGVYQAAVGSLPDALMDWMQDVAEEYGDDADLDDLIRRGEVDPPRIVYGEQVMETFDRLLAECLEHNPKSGNSNDKLTEQPTRQIIAALDPNEHTVPLGFQCIRLGSNRSGVRGFRMAE